MEFVKVTFSVQVRVDSHGDEKVPGSIIQIVTASMDVGRVVVEKIDRIQLPSLNVEDTL